MAGENLNVNWFLSSHLHFNLVSMILFSELQRINEARSGGIDLSFQLLGILGQKGHMLNEGLSKLQ